jgi:hypothetical protein
MLRNGSTTCRALERSTFRAPTAGMQVLAALLRANKPPSRVSSGRHSGRVSIREPLGISPSIPSHLNLQHQTTAWQPTRPVKWAASSCTCARENREDDLDRALAWIRRGTAKPPRCHGPLGSIGRARHRGRGVQGGGGATFAGPMVARLPPGNLERDHRRCRIGSQAGEQRTGACPLLWLWARAYEETAVNDRLRLVLPIIAWPSPAGRPQPVRRARG